MTTYSVATLAQLKTALASAAANGQADVITLTTNLLATSSADFTAGTGGMDLVKIAITDGQALSIVGGGFTLDADFLGRALEVANGGAVTISNLTISEGALAGRGGDYGQAGGAALGAGIYNTGNLTLTNVTVRANAASGGGGGGGASYHAGGGGGGGSPGSSAGAGGAGFGTYSGGNQAGGAASGGTGGTGGAEPGYQAGGAGGSTTGGAGGRYSYSGGAGGTAGVSGLSVGGGGGGAGDYAPVGAGGMAVAGIFNGGTLSLSGSSVTGNVAAGGGGGAGDSYDVGGAGGAAVGGIENAGTLTLGGGSVSGNVAAGGAGGGNFRGIGAAGAGHNNLDGAIPNIPHTGGVSLSGAATQGQTLTAANTLADADGLGTIRYQWKSDGANISGATGSTFTLGQAQVGHTITVTGSYTDGHGFAESATSSGTSSVANVNDAPTGSVAISGAATQGQTLTASNTLADADGLGAISYQWRSDGTNISGATGSTLTLAHAQAGHVITVAASYTDGFGAAESVSSAGTAAVTGVNSAPTGSVTISGAATQGQTLTASNTLADADGLGTIGYQWKSDGTNISGATGATITLGQAQVGHLITVAASYTDGGATAESVSSATTLAVANVNDAPTGLPTVSGSAVAGSTLTVDASGIADADGLGVFSYAWKADGAAISGATGTAFTLGSAQVGHLITVTASYIDGGATAESVTSAPGAAVTAPPPPPDPPPPSGLTNATVDGALVSTVTTTAPDGSQTHTIVVDPLPAGRIDTIGGGSTADIPLVILGDAHLVTIGLPTGTGFSATGPAAPGSEGSALPVLVGSIGAAASTGDHQQMGDGASAFLQLHSATPIVIQTITLTGTHTDSPLSIDGLAAGSGATTALVIDTHDLAGQTQITLDNIDFAAVIGAAHITGGAGSQTVFADSAAQYIVLGADDDTLHGGGGNDTVGSAAGDDNVFGDDGNDSVFGGIGNDIVNGGTGDDVVQGNQGADVVQGNMGNDTVYGGQGDDTVYGGQGDDQVWGDIGNDSVFGNLGADTLDGGDGDDTVQGNQANDLVQGGAGNDLVYGGQGNDTVGGGLGNDRLFGDLGDDVLSGGLGNDTMTGGAGADTFVFAKGDGADLITDFNRNEGDHVQLSGPHGAYAATQVWADTVVDFGGGEMIVLANVQLSSLNDGWIVG